MNEARLAEAVRGLRSAEDSRSAVESLVAAGHTHPAAWETSPGDRITAAASTLGITFVGDQLHLRSGELWNERLLDLIDGADVFQLYWSTNARSSQYVEQEWRHAVGLGRPNFVRPLYWEQPMPEVPEPLRSIHFSFYALGA